MNFPPKMGANIRISSITKQMGWVAKKMQVDPPILSDF
jgi:hypothetical protein